MMAVPIKESPFSPEIEEAGEDAFLIYMLQNLSKTPMPQWYMDDFHEAFSRRNYSLEQKIGLVPGFFSDSVPSDSGGFDPRPRHHKHVFYAWDDIDNDPIMLGLEAEWKEPHA